MMGPPLLYYTLQLLPTSEKGRSQIFDGPQITRIHGTAERPRSVRNRRVPPKSGLTSGHHRVTQSGSTQPRKGNVTP